MKVKKYLIYYLILIPILCILWNLSPIEFSKSNAEKKIISGIIFVSIFVDLLVLMNLTGFNVKKANKSKYHFFIRIFVNIFLGGVLFIFLSVIWLVTIASSLHETVIFHLKTNPNVRIVTSYISYGGAFDSGPFVYITQKVTPFTPLFQIRKNIDTNSIVKHEWIRTNSFIMNIRH